MRKAIPAVLAALLWLLTGCAAGPEKSAAAAGSPYFQAGRRCAAWSGTGYYFTANRFLYYAGEDTMSPVPVCSRPECLHDRETDPEKIALCNAYFEPYMRGDAAVFFSDGRLYVLTPDGVSLQDGAARFALYEVSPDGASRRKRLQLRRPAGTQMPDTVLISGGELLLAAASYDEEENASVDVGAYPLTGISHTPRPLYRGGSGGYVSALLGAGDYLYFQELDGSGVYRQRILNRKTGETVLLGQLPAYKDLSALECVPFAGGLIVSALRGGEVCLLKADPDGGDPAEWVSADRLPVPSAPLMASDDRYLYLLQIRDTGGEPHTILTALTPDGRAAASLDMTALVPGFQEVQLTSGRHLLINAASHGENSLWYLDKDALSGGSVRPVRFYGGT